MLAAAVTASAAVVALFRWRGDQRWKDNRDVARAIVRGCIRVRDGFIEVRNRYIFGSEAPEDAAPTLGPEDDATRYRGRSHVYEARLKVLDKALRELDAAVLEGETLWGSAIEDGMREVRLCRHELISNIQSYLQIIRAGRENAPEDRDQNQEVRRVVHASVEDGDPFSLRVRAALQGLLDVAQPHLEH